MKTKNEILIEQGLDGMNIGFENQLLTCMEEYAKQFIESSQNLTDTTKETTEEEVYNEFTGRKVFVWIPLARYEELLTKEEQFDNQNKAKKSSITN